MSSIGNFWCGPRLPGKPNFPTTQELEASMNEIVQAVKERRMATRCKFMCSGVTKRKSSHWDSKANKSVDCFVYDAEFYAVSSGSDENKNFFASTPTGNLKVATYRDNQFEPGKEYYLDISEA